MASEHAGPLVDGRFRVERELGRGAHGRVVLAVDVRHNRPVALKLRPANDRDHADLLAEARTLLSMRPHDSVALAREDFFTDDLHVVVMDYVEGESLEQIVARRGAPGLVPSAVLGYLRPLAAALDHLHSHEPPIVHGDVKPANVLVAPDGRVVLVDFGLADHQGSAGTPGFVAPEVAAGAPLAPPADVFGFAATVVALLTGQPPVVGSPAFDGLDARTARGFDACVRQGLSLDAERRPASAGALLERLEQALGADLPSGSVTLLSTLVDDSDLLTAQPAEAVDRALDAYRTIVASAVTSRDGRFLGLRGEAYGTLSVFTTAAAAAAAALELQRRIATFRWPTDALIAVRASLHSGDAEARDGDYSGPVVDRATRLVRAAHGGQILTSSATAELLKTSAGCDGALHDLGRHRLSEQSTVERVFQLHEHSDDGPWREPRSVRAEARNNLPAITSGLIGREQELEAVEELTRAARVTTLVGSGGSGKTRLGVEIARRVLDEYDNVWFAELASHTTAEGLALHVARQIGIAVTPGADAQRSLAAALRDQHVFLVVDNCEHLIEAAAHFVEALVLSCANLTVLATSREPLAVDGEHQFRLPPLSYPMQAVVSARQLAGSAAAELFAARADEHERFTLTNATAPGVAAICKRLDGIPLAIELAAARTPTMTVDEIVTGLDRCFDLLVGSRRTAPARQQTLRATIDWSYQLLAPAEQQVLRRLAVFVDGFDRSAAEAVCSDGDLTPPSVGQKYLPSLVAKNLIVINATRDRYAMLETIRQFAFELLTGADRTAEYERTARRHADYYARWARGRAGPVFWTTEQYAKADALVVERANLYRGLEHLWKCGDVGAFIETLSALWLWFMWNRSELHALLAPALERDLADVPPDLLGIAHALAVVALTRVDSARALAHSERAFEAAPNPHGDERILIARASGTLVAGDIDSATEAANDLLRLAEANDHPALRAMALKVMAYAEASAGPVAESRIRELVAAASECERHDEFDTLTHAAEFMMDRGDLDGAAQCFARLRVVMDDLPMSYPAIGSEIIGFAWLALLQERPVDAGDAFLASFDARCADASSGVYVSEPVRGLACVATDLGDARTAIVLDAWADASLERHGSPGYAVAGRIDQRSVRSLATHPEFDEYSALGRAMNLGDVYDFIHDHFPMEPASPPRAAM
jgi:predicted ATPase/class 3 adenylate cyclase